MNNPTNGLEIEELDGNCYCVPTQDSLWHQVLYITIVAFWILTFSVLVFPFYHKIGLATIVLLLFSPVALVLWHIPRWTLLPIKSGSTKSTVNSLYGDDQSDFGSFRVDGGTIQFRGKRWGFQLPLPALQQQDWSGNKLSIRLPNQSVSMTFAKADADRIRCIDGARNSGVIPTIFPPLHESNNLLLARERYPWTNLLMAQLLIGNVLRAAVKEGKFNESMAVDVGSVILVGTIIVVITIIDPAPKARKRIANFRKRLTGKLIADKDTGLWQVETSTQSPDSTTLSRESS